MSFEFYHVVMIDDCYSNLTHGLKSDFDGAILAWNALQSQPTHLSIAYIPDPSIKEIFTGNSSVNAICSLATIRP